MALIKNASPEFITLGIKDMSSRLVPLENTPLPQHLPLFFLYTQKGPTERKVVDAASFNVLYGNESLKANTPYFNHASRFAACALSYNGAVMVQRVVSKDAGVKANAIIYLDVLKTNLVNYTRKSDGSLIPNPNSNDYEINMDTPIVEGYRIKWIKEYITANEAEALGSFEPKPGTMTDQYGNQSTMYPIFEARAKEKGSYYNNIGFGIGSLFGDDVDEEVKDSTASLPFKLTLFTKENDLSSPVQFQTLYGEPNMTISLREKTLNPVTNSRMDLEYVFDNSWFNTSDSNLPYVYPNFEGLYFYRKNYELLVRSFVETERNFVSIEEKVWADGKKGSTLSWYDFTTLDFDKMLDQAYMINPFACSSSKKVKYFTIQYDSGISTNKVYQREINMSNEVPIFLEGGSDGSMTDLDFEDAVIQSMKLYGDPNSEYQDLAVNVENTLWDSGFSVKCKEELVNFFSVRKDTVLVLSTHEAKLGKKDHSLSTSRAIGVALRSRMRLCPESVYYGTPVARGLIIVGTYKLRDGGSDDRVPLTYDLLLKTCRMMGSGDGKWKRDRIFDRVYGTDDNPGSLITSGTDIRPYYIANNVKPTLWTTGLVWAQPFDLNSFHFPAIQTIYDDDTSVLNSFFTLMAASTLTKVNAEAWRRFTGTTSYSDGEFTNLVEEWLRARTADIFADIFKVGHDVFLTETDKLRGYSWQQQSTLYSENLRTKAVFTLIAQRKSALEENEASN